MQTSTLKLLFVAAAAFLASLLAIPSAAFPQNGLHTGEVKQLLVNPRGDVDGLLLTLSESQQNVVVKIPPYLRSAAPLVRRGDVVQFQGTKILSFPNPVYDRVSILKNNQVVLDDTQGLSDVPPGNPIPNAGEPLQNMTAQGRIAAVSSNPDGKIDEVILEDGTVAKIPPHVRRANSISPRIGLGVTIEGIGGIFDGHKSIETRSIQNLAE